MSLKLWRLNGDELCGIGVCGSLLMVSHCSPMDRSCTFLNGFCKDFGICLKMLKPGPAVALSCASFCLNSRRLAINLASDGLADKMWFDLYAETVWVETQYRPLGL
ncbi:hypothetical protein Nepgr_020404 [Nepenthes gracilis]|uniref:Uncharacterized protein n=1 Tax=Nepenthes gracilis TaxID=150966 RepID=A0AAD3SVZ1_NEPGR|nr:hypothetical protein Nepgr_020404 [Nepenthes gracilis]